MTARAAPARSIAAAIPTRPSTPCCCAPGRSSTTQRREALLQQATRIVVEDAGIIPTHLQKNVWAMRQGFVHTPRVDERTRAQDVRQAQR